MSCVVSSRTWGGGQARRCPICRALSWVEPSLNTGDAPCPCCGHLLWPVHHVRRAIAQGLQTPTNAAYRLGRTFRQAAERFTSTVRKFTRSTKRKKIAAKSTSGAVWDPWLDA